MTPAAPLTFRFSPANDPYPTGSDARKASWGDLQLRASGRLLTRMEVDGASLDAVRWYAEPVVSWLAHNLSAVFNEERLPHPIEEVTSASQWFLRTARAPLLTEAEEERWFDERQDWWTRHALRAGADGGVLPNVFFRRVGAWLECSWDNTHFAPSRRGMQFVDREGVEFIDLTTAARAVSEFIASLPEAFRPSLTTEASDWARFALPSHVRTALRQDPRTLERLLARYTRLDLPFLPAAGAPLGVLSDIPPEVSAGTVQEIARLLLRDPGARHDGDALERIRSPRPPTTIDPWLSGYDRALAVRRALRLGETPVADMSGVLKSLGVATQSIDAEPQFEGARTLRANGQAQILTNATGRLGQGPFALARELGHLVMDAAPGGELGGVSSAWEPWVLSARAKAFAVMFLMPEDALRGRRLGNVDSAGLRQIATEFHVSPRTAAWHLGNLRVISEERRDELLQNA